MSNETKFTKIMKIGIPTDNAPYCVDGFCNIDGERFEVCSVWGVNNESDSCEQVVANAHLFAAAPEMYSALRGILDSVKLTELESEYINDLLTKARGETK